jgi:hypothetical protein
VCNAASGGAGWGQQKRKEEKHVQQPLRASLSLLNMGIWNHDMMFSSGGGTA